MGLVYDSGVICPQHWRNGQWQKTGDTNPLPVEAWIWNGSTWVQVSTSNPIPVMTIGQNSNTLNPVSVTQAPKASYQTLKSWTGTISTSTTSTTVVTLYTVTSGKTFYLTDFVCCNNNASPAQVSVNASTTPGSSPVFIGHTINTAPLEALNIGSEPSVTGGSTLTFQCGPTGSSTTVTYFIAGYEQ